MGCLNYWPMRVSSLILITLLLENTVIFCSSDNANDAQLYMRLMEENRHKQHKQQNKQQQMGHTRNGRPTSRSVSAGGEFDQPSRNHVKHHTEDATWTSPDGDPYSVTTARFQAAEKLKPFTFLNDQPFKCPSQFTIASTISHPEIGTNIASCFDFCAGNRTCA